jgi:hypothetical protein
MTYLLGADEAGYGPNLGPLVISVTVWEVPDEVGSQDLYGLLGDAVSARPPQGRRRGACGLGPSPRARRSGSRVSRALPPAPRPPSPLWIGDSKVLYQSGQGLRHLELGVLSALELLERRPNGWRHVWQCLAPDAVCQRDTIPWYSDYEVALPRVIAGGEAIDAAAALRRGLAAQGVRLVDVRSRVVFEGPFNCLVDRFDSKGEALSQTTLGLVAEVCRAIPAGPVRVICDKHGGRDHYALLLSQNFPECVIEICGEGRESSCYRFGPPQRRVEVRFQARAESHLPAALASMASKYLRELAMEAFNAFWCQRVPGLCRTAGYPGDARRFKADIAAAQTALGIADRLLWRCR